jgi:ABC-2 type transport system permease protein
MINLLRAEWIKLRTVTMNWVLGIIALAFPLVVTLLTAFFRGDEDFTAQQLLETLTGTSFVPVLLLGVIAAANITSEFGFGTIRPTFAATPRRLRVLLAKAVVVVAVGLTIEAVVVVVGTVAGKALAQGQGSTIDFGEAPTATAALVGIVVLAGLMALAGLGIGMLVRNTPGAIAILILWPLLVEGLVGALLTLVFDSDTPLRWLPFRAGFRMAQLNFVDDGPSRLVSGLYFGAVAVAIAAAGAWLVNRRDA